MSPSLNNPETHAPARNQAFTRHNTYMEFVRLNSQIAATPEEISHLCAAFCPHIPAIAARDALIETGSVATPGLYVGEAAYILQLQRSTGGGAAQPQRISLSRAEIRGTAQGQKHPYINEAALFAAEHWGDRLVWYGQCYGLLVSEFSLSPSEIEPVLRAVVALSRPYSTELWGPQLDSLILNIVSATTVAHLEYAAAGSVLQPLAEEILCRHCRDVHRGVPCRCTDSAPSRLSAFIHAHSPMWHG